MTDQPGTATDLFSLEIPGIEMETAKKLLSNNTELFRKLLQKFLANYSEAPAKISDLIANDDIEAAHRMAHSIKGVAGSLGMTQLQACAADLEMTLSRGDGIYHGQLEDFTSSLMTVVDGLLANEEFLTDSSETDLPEGSIEELKDNLEQMQDALKEFKPKPCRELLQEINSWRWPEAFSKDLDDLERLVKRYRFQEALEVQQNFIEKVELAMK